MKPVRQTNPHPEDAMNVKKTITAVLILLLVLLSGNQLIPCASFFARGKGARLFGRGYDFFTHTGFLVINTRGVAKQALVYPGDIPASWISQYGSITFNQVGQEYPTGGMNEAGLVIECMWLHETLYPIKDSRPTVMEMQFMQYILDTCGTVEEIRNAERKVRIIQNSQPIHFLAADRNGRALIIEFISGYTYLYPVDRNHPAALTNSSYADSLTYLKRFRKFGGNEEIRKTLYSVDRFAQLAEAIGDRRPTVEKAFSWLDLVHVEPGKAGESYTCWNIVYDPVNLKIHFRVFGKPGIHTLSLSDYKLDCQTGTRYLDLEDIGSKDLKTGFAPLTPEQNTRLVKRTFAIFKKNNFMTSMPDMYLNILGNYPASFKCADSQ
jgi:choloylglycine hydrolase